jgi:hypothetical protein
MNFRSSCGQLTQSISAAYAGSFAPPDAVDERAALKRPVADDRDLPLEREGQDARLDLTVGRVVGDLHEVDRLRPHDPLDHVVPPAVRRLVTPT